MPNIHEVVDKNNIATDSIVGTQGPIDTVAAELVLRNTAVAADRLTPAQFQKLGTTASTALLEAASAARGIAPLSAEDVRQLPTETDSEHIFRTQVQAPLNRFQLAVSIGDFNNDHPEMQKVVKRAIWLGSTAFEKVVTDPSATEFVELSRTTRYFDGNATAASRRVERAQPSAS